jgi:capsular polysaccharide biosynthesis protein
MISKLLDWFSNYLAHRKGLLPLIGIGLVVINLVLQFFISPDHWLTGTNLLMHLGVIIAIFGMMLAWAL